MGHLARRVSGTRILLFVRCYLEPVSTAGACGASKQSCVSTPDATGASRWPSASPISIAYLMGWVSYFALAETPGTFEELTSGCGEDSEPVAGRSRSVATRASAICNDLASRSGRPVSAGPTRGRGGCGHAPGGQAPLLLGGTRLAQSR